MNSISPASQFFSIRNQARNPTQETRPVATPAPKLQEKSVVVVKTTTPTATPTHETPKLTEAELRTVNRIVAVGIGFFTSGAIFSTGLVGMAFYETLFGRMYWRAKEEFLLCLAWGSMVGGIASGVATSRSLPKKLDEKAAPATPEKAQNGNKPGAAPQTPDEAEERIRNAKKMVETIWAGFVGGTTVLGTFVTLEALGWLGWSNPFRPQYMGGFGEEPLLFSVLAGAITMSARKYSELSKISSEPSKNEKTNPAPPAKRSTLSKVAESVTVAWATHSRSLILCILGLQLRPGDAPHFLLPCATFGALSGLKRYNELTKGDLSLAQQWKAMTRSQKKRVIGTSLAALTTLGVLYVGPGKVANKIGEIISSAIEGAKNFHDQMAYTTKTTTDTKTKGAWISGLTLNEEAERLASLLDEPGYAPSCAEILNTCHLDANDKGHKRTYHTKSRDIHPDKFKLAEDKTNAMKAQKLLNRAIESIQGRDETRIDLVEEKDFFGNTKKDSDGNVIYKEVTTLIKKGNPGCPGKNDGFCSVSNETLSKTRFLRVPNWLYKQFGMESECIGTWEGGEPEKMKMDACQDLT